MEKPKLDSIKFDFSQEGNTCGTTEDYEGLIIECDSSDDLEKNPFYVLRTKGWSINNIEELKELFDKIENCIKHAF